jgi:hypothetical protein
VATCDRAAAVRGPAPRGRRGVCARAARGAGAGVLPRAAVRLELRGQGERDRARVLVRCRGRPAAGRAGADRHRRPPGVDHGDGVDAPVRRHRARGGPRLRRTGAVHGAVGGDGAGRRDRGGARRARATGSPRPQPARDRGANPCRTAGADAADRLRGPLRTRRRRVRGRAVPEQRRGVLPRAAVRHQLGGKGVDARADLRVRRLLPAAEPSARDADRGGPLVVGTRERPLPGTARHRLHRAAARCGRADDRRVVGRAGARRRDRRDVPPSRPERLQGPVRPQVLRAGADPRFGRGRGRPRRGRARASPARGRRA